MSGADVTACPLCGGGESSPFDQRRLHGYTVSNRLCRACGLVYQSPRMSEAELDVFYAQEYRRLYQGSAGPNPKDLSIQEKRAASLQEFARGQVPAAARHLDIGCSAGLLLQRFQAAYGCQPVGVEPGEAYRAYAQESGLRVYPSLEELLAAGEGRFDLISLAHVLEHLPHPVEYLVTLRQRALTPDGWLLIETPNLYGHDCFEVAHLTAFSRHTLAQTLGKAGLDIAALNIHGKPRSARLPLYLTALARPAQSSASFALRAEGGVRLKRAAGMLRKRLLSRLRLA
ncbi:MAG: class I SAM-dependent methyltransferase [Chloroflexi bacterium]|nr:class I SAM-dependent methyltransferase [Chloroflexota bacterium]